MEAETIKLGKRGVLVIPASIRETYGLTEGSLVMVEGRPEGVMVRPVAAFPIEKYTPEEKARFLLANTVTDEDQAWAVKEVRKLGLDPEKYREGKNLPSVQQK